MYRLCWFDEFDVVKGISKVMEISKNGSLLVVGLEDGYLFIYYIDLGYLVG